MTATARREDITMNEQLSHEGRLLLNLRKAREHLVEWANKRAWHMVRTVLDCIKQLQTRLNAYGWKFIFAEEI